MSFSDQDGNARRPISELAVRIPAPTVLAVMGEAPMRSCAVPVLELPSSLLCADAKNYVGFCKLSRYLLCSPWVRHAKYVVIYVPHCDYEDEDQAPDHVTSPPRRTQ